MSALTPLLLDYDNAARLLGMPRGALRDLVYKRRGPATVPVGRRTLFAYKDLEAWVDAHRMPAPPPPPKAPLPPRKRGRPSIADIENLVDYALIALSVINIVGKKYFYKS